MHATPTAFFFSHTDISNEAVDTVLAMRMREPITAMDRVAALDPLLVGAVRAYLALDSTFYRVDAHAYAEGASFDLRALVQRAQDGRVDVLRWVI